MTGTSLTRAVCAPIRLYRVVFAGARPHCRYWPSCSQYALESIELHGSGRGLWLAVKRIGRCHPWGGFGVDPVPERLVGGRAQVRDPAQVRGQA